MQSHLHAVSQRIAMFLLWKKGSRFQGLYVSHLHVALRVTFEKMCRDRKAEKMEKPSAAVSCVQQDSEIANRILHSAIAISQVISSVNGDLWGKHKQGSRH